ncbi:MAG: hypothetical protein MJ062_00945 [Oscillospiraceae bacterium]|nr:hypothetical protein [Oscillospiraceae bacterium]
MNPDIIVAVFSSVFIFGMIVVFAILGSKLTRKLHPPYHTVNEFGDVSVFIYLSSKYSHRYHEYLFINTVDGLKYKCSKKKKIGYTLWFVFAALAFLGPMVFTIIMIGFSVLFCLIFILSFIGCLGIAGFAEYMSYRTAKKYLDENVNNS